MTRTMDFDALQKERVRRFVNDRIQSNDRIRYDGLFNSEFVATTLHQEKMVLSGFKPDKIRAILPFTPVVYIPICSHCVKPEDFEAFKTLVRSSLVVPVLIGNYGNFEENLREFIIAHNHISSVELSGYLFLSASSKGLQPLCSNCLRKEVNDLCLSKKGEPDSKIYESDLRQFISHLDPFPRTDRELIDLAFNYFKNRELKKLRQLTRMGSLIQQIRRDEAFNAPVLLEDSDLSKLPDNLSDTVDEAHSKTASLRKMTADGLGISIPVDMPLEPYIELVKDYQPRISATITSVLKAGNNEASVLDVSRNIIAINSEIERIKGLRRYAVLDACIGFYRDNKLLAAATMLAGSLGLAGSLAGCVTAGGAAIGASVAKKKGWLKSTEATDRLRRMVNRDVQPAVDLFLKAYLGAKAPAINVLSLRKRIASVKDTVFSKKVA